MENNAREFDGKPFNGKTVAIYFEHHGAVITAAAKIIRSILEQQEVVNRGESDILVRLKEEPYCKGNRKLK